MHDNRAVYIPVQKRYQPTLHKLSTNNLEMYKIYY